MTEESLSVHAFHELRPPSFGAVLEHIGNLYEPADFQLCWFRGHGRAEWTLSPTLHRFLEQQFREVPVVEPEAWNRLLNQEWKRAFRVFQSYATASLTPPERTHWGLLFAMRHYGLPSRLLDWSRSFACALYFAVDEWRSGTDASIYLLRPEPFNKVMLEREELVFLHEMALEETPDTRPWHPAFVKEAPEPRTIAVWPVFVNPRMLAQRAMCLLVGDLREPLESQLAGIKTAETIVEKIILAAPMRDDAVRYLQIVGADAFSYFPDLDGIARQHREHERDNLLRLRAMVERAAGR